MIRIWQPALGLMALIMVSAATASTSIDTTPSWNGTSNAAPFGEPDTATFGQSISIDASGGSLQSFTFYLSALDLDIKPYVFEWDGIKAIGAPVFMGASFNIGDQFSGYRAVTVDTGAVPLGANKQYVLMLTSSGLQASRLNINSWGALTSDTYVGGEFVFHNSGNDLSSLTAAQGWDCGDGCGFYGSGADLVFKAQIAPATPQVPEPASYALMLGGLALITGLKLRRNA